MPSNSRRYLFPFVRSNGTALRSVLRLLFKHSRHAAAAALGAEGPVLVLGRWTFTVENATDFAANRLFETLVALGAVTAGGPTS